MTDKKHKLKVNIAELIDAFEMGSIEYQAYLELETGAILFGESLDVDEFELGQIQDELSSEEAESVGTRFIAIPWVESREGYRDMELFIDTVEDNHMQQLLTVAIDGQGAFRRFKNVLYGQPEERERWFAFKNDRMRQRVLEWLDNEGIEVVE